MPTLPTILQEAREKLEREFGRVNLGSHTSLPKYPPKWYLKDDVKLEAVTKFLDVQLTKAYAAGERNKLPKEWKKGFTEGIFQSLREETEKMKKEELPVGLGHNLYGYNLAISDILKVIDTKIKELQICANENCDGDLKIVQGGHIHP